MTSKVQEELTAASFRAYAVDGNPDEGDAVPLSLALEKCGKLERENERLEQARADEYRILSQAIEETERNLQSARIIAIDRAEQLATREAQLETARDGLQAAIDHLSDPFGWEFWPETGPALSGYEKTATDKAKIKAALAVLSPPTEQPKGKEQE